MPAHVIRTVKELRSVVQQWRQLGLTVGLVPTMGALHKGHISLVQEAFKTGCDKVVLSIFVNPKQFGPHEDLTAYPRQEHEDVELAGYHGVDVIFAPTNEEMYPSGFTTNVQVIGLTDVLCGVTRPGHFDGVATVIIKLLNQAMVDHAFFGEKDFQQLVIIRQLAADLNSFTQIHGVPTLREGDGLALSSRNKYLTENERVIAPKLYQTLQNLRQNVITGNRISECIQHSRVSLLAAGFEGVDYLDVRNADTLKPAEMYNPYQPARIFVAAQLGRARLIDNIAV